MQLVAAFGLNPHDALHLYIEFPQTFLTIKEDIIQLQEIPLGNVMRMLDRPS